MRPHEHVSVTVASLEKGPTKVYTGFLKSMQQDFEYSGGNDLQLEIAVMSESTAPIKREEVQMKYIATLISDKATKTTKVYLEVNGQPDHYVVRGKEDEQFERKMGEEMPLYDVFPNEILAPILEAARCSDLYNHQNQSFQIANSSPVCRIS